MTEPYFIPSLPNYGLGVPCTSEWVNRASRSMAEVIHAYKVTSHAHRPWYHKL